MPGTGMSVGVVHMSRSRGGGAVADGELQSVSARRPHDPQPPAPDIAPPHENRTAKSTVAAPRKPRAKSTKSQGAPQASPAVRATAAPQASAPPMAVANETSAHLGELLVHLRETYPERRGLVAPGSPQMRLTAKALARCLNEAGYSMTSGSYSMLEQGKSLPKNPRLFFETLEHCLALDSASDDARRLRELYLLDYSARALEPRYTVQINVTAVSGIVLA